MRKLRLREVGLYYSCPLQILHIPLFSSLCLVMSILTLRILSESLLSIYLATILTKLLSLQDIEKCATEDLNRKYSTPCF